MGRRVAGRESPRRFWLAAAGVGVLAAAGGYAVRHWLAGEAAPPVANAAAVRALIDKPLPDLKGQNRRLADWRGHVLVVNFWATWCTPCRKEIPEFVRAQDRHGGKGLQIIGVAFDQPEPVAKFVLDYKMNYPVLIAGLDTMVLMREVGNRAGALPFTLILDRQGGATGTHLGALSEADLDSIASRLL